MKSEPDSRRLRYSVGTSQRSRGLPRFLLPLLLFLALAAVVQAQDYTFTTNSGTIIITRYLGSGGAVTIPSTINGLPVTGIGDSAFLFQHSLTSITIPNSVTSIGDQAFAECIGLTSVTIPNSVTSIGEGTFWSCSRLASVTIPNSVTSIGNYTFRFCSSLTNVTIPNSVTSIGTSAFAGCSLLTSITIPSGVTSIGSNAFAPCGSLAAITVDSFNPFYRSVAGVLFNQNQTVLIQCPGGKTGSYAVPNSVTNIGDQAFQYCTSLTSVMIPNSVTSIGTSAFVACSHLTSITIPSSVTSIADQAFYYCIGLTSVTIPDSVTSIGTSAFAGCSLLTSITIPNSVTSIGDQACYECSSLTSVTVGNSVTNIGSAAFAVCNNLTGVYFKGNAPSGDSYVFDGADSAISYYLPGTTGWGLTFGGRPTAPWFLPKPLILNTGPSFGVKTNWFGFIISWATNAPVAVEACTNLATPLWSPVATNTLTDGWSYFSDPDWANHPNRFYRLRSP